jgi:8-oxo-dGTP pyrophosphatase MutT (NUDIX family)
VPAQVPPGLDFAVERTSVRVVLRDAAGRVLLFRTVDPLDAATGTWWELPGGGMEAGESVAETAAREVCEETGWTVSVAALASQPGPSWTRSATYLRRGRRILQHEYVVALRIDEQEPEPASAGRTPEELEDYVGYRWWPVEEVLASGERFFPGRLPELLAPFLDGETIDEPFEWWN